MPWKPWVFWHDIPLAAHTHAGAFNLSYAWMEVEWMTRSCAPSIQLRAARAEWLPGKTEGGGGDTCMDAFNLSPAWITGVCMHACAWAWGLHGLALQHSTPFPSRTAQQSCLIMLVLARKPARRCRVWQLHLQKGTVMCSRALESNPGWRSFRLFGCKVAVHASTQWCWQPVAISTNCASHVWCMHSTVCCRTRPVVSGVQHSVWCTVYGEQHCAQECASCMSGAQCRGCRDAPAVFGAQHYVL